VHFLDLEKVDDFQVPLGVTAAVIVGGVVDYKECLEKYDYAYQINCVNIPKLVDKLLRHSIYICFVSTNTVFSSRLSPPKEYEIPNPGFHYARLKAITEFEIIKLGFSRGLSGIISIIRLTKNVEADTAPFSSWIKSLAENRQINAFKDLFFAPVTFEASGEAISKLVEARSAGIFHFSGASDIDYESFAIGLCNFLKVPTSLVNGTTSREQNIELLYKERVTALSMERITRSLGCTPVTLAEVYGVLSSNFYSHNGPTPTEREQFLRQVDN
jgi:dTDP-4-dehydrorhamnose reductase